MGAAELRDKFRDIPGIENLTIRLEGGMEVYSLGGPFISLAPLASDAEIEAALRSIVPTSATIAPVPFTAAPSIIPLEAKATMSTNPADAAQSIKGLMSDHMRLMGDIHAAQLEILRTSLAKQRDTVSTAVASVSAKIASQTDEFTAAMSEFTNAIAGENL